ncbi:LOW QUALITY PROTEIN: hypothetical protein ACHAXN_009816, partial [Cyclotella atomus]
HGHVAVIKALIEAGATLILDAAKREKEESCSSPYIDGVTQRTNELVEIGDKHYNEKDWETASQWKATKCNRNNYVIHGKLAESSLNDAVCFKQGYVAAERCTELEPEYEKGWKLLSRTYKLPWRELSAFQIADHNSAEYQRVYSRIYEEGWIRPSFLCSFCELKCMELPLPENSPFCGCPKNRKPGDDDEDIIDYFTCQWEERE